MFADHQPLIARHAMASSEAFADVLRFVVATIQQPLWATPEIVADFKAHGDASRWAIFGKGEALRYIEANRDQIFDLVGNLWHGPGDPETCARRVLGYLATLPGLGLVKSGFVCQLALGHIGCLDTHNVGLYGLNPNTFKSSRYKALKSPAKRRQLIDLYADTCLELGGCAVLWDEWCHFVAHHPHQAERYQYDPNRVSALHCVALGIDPAGHSQEWHNWRLAA